VGPLNQFKRIPLNFKLQRGLLAALLAWPTFTLAQSNVVNPSEQVPALYQQALNALQNKQFENAAQLLQQVVLQHPELAGAWLDLSWLALRQENFAQAEEFLLILEQRFAPLPEGIQLAVNQLKLQLSAHLKLEQASASSARHQTAFSMATGYDNNINAGLRFSTITLTLPDRNL
jgi:predicted Zn-dependent protease